jgi:protein-tyrosine phosphatase
MVDIHSHILPEVDDGARSWDIAVEMCRIAAADGITHMVATPHANDIYAYDRAQHGTRLAKLREMVGPLQLSLGCDFHFSYDNVQDALANPRRYTIGETGYLLIEFSDYAIPPFVGRAISDLLDAGLTPILTHPERNPILQKRPQDVLQMANDGCVVQVTASALTGRWGETARKMAHWLLKHDAVHVLASDAHDTRSRSPVLSAGRDAVEELMGYEVAQALVEGNPQAIVTDQPLPYFPVAASK